MDATTLRDLPRAALQKLAKENDIKANLKSDAIVRLLVERNTKKKPVSCANSVVSSKGTGSASIRPSPLRFPAANNDVWASIDHLHHGPDPPTYPDPAQAEQGRRRSASAETTDPFVTPESSIAGTPEPEANSLLLQRTVEMITDIDRIDKQTMDKVTHMRTFAAKLRIRANELHGLVQAERSMRKRMEDYLAHWTQMNPRWTYQEIWSGQIRVQDMYTGLEVSTSDEEDPEVEDNDRYGNAINTADQVTTTPQTHAVQRRDAEVAPRIVPSVGAEGFTGTPRKAKRQRDEDSNDGAQEGLDIVRAHERRNPALPSPDNARRNDEPRSTRRRRRA